MKVLERWQREVIAVFRIVIGFLFGCHGAAALFGVDALLPVQNGGEKAALFCFAFLLIAFPGNGAWALERQQKATAAAE
jgi:uncharacterized membrane protein YphA (DoxX/SURF4 family)